MKHHHSCEHQPSNNQTTSQEKVASEPVETASSTDNQLISCQSDLKELHEKFLRVNADLHNFKNRMAREKASWIQDANIQMLKDLLPVVDNFERAFVTADGQQLETADKKWLDGLHLTYKELTKFLYDKGVREIDCSTSFDPQVHEAIAHVAVPNKAAGDIIEVHQKGYMLNDIVIRPAQVSVAK